MDDLKDLPNSRHNARVAGSPRYFTGEPCKHGHITFRWTSGTGCSECARLHDAERTKTTDYKIRRAEYATARKERRLAASPPVQSAIDKARRTGTQKYSTGEPCKRGHMSLRYANSGACIECCAEDRRARREAKRAAASNPTP